MTEQKKRGRPSQNKTIRPYTIDQKIADFIGSLPDGDRSKFVNSILVQGVEVEKLSGKFYNYLLIRSNGVVFYVGKGTGNRINDHESEARKGMQSHKCNIIRQEWANGEEIIKQKIAFFDNEEDAYQLEVLLINFFGRENLANGTDGGEGGPGRPSTGRVWRHYTLDKEVVAYLDSLPAEDMQRFVDDAIKKGIERYKAQHNPRW